MIFSLLIKYSPLVGNGKLAESTSFTAALHPILSFLTTEDETDIIETLDVLQKMVIDKFYASAQAYFCYLSLNIHNNTVRYIYLGAFKQIFNKHF
jgi:hypothetical protein